MCSARTCSSHEAFDGILLPTASRNNELDVVRSGLLRLIAGGLSLVPIKDGVDLPYVCGGGGGGRGISSNRENRPQRNAGRATTKSR